MSNLAIRLHDLDRLTGLLPDCTTPRAVAEIARAAVEIRPEGEALTLTVAVEIDDSKLDEHLAWLTKRAVHGAAADAGDGPDEAEASAGTEPDQLPRVSAHPQPDSPVAQQVEPERQPDAPQAQQVEPECQPVHPDAPAATAADNFQSRSWSDAETARLMAARAEGLTFAQIAEELARTVKACEVRFRKLRKDGPASAPALAPAKPPASASSPLAPAAKPAVPVPAPAPVAAAEASGVARLVEAIAALDDSFDPADDKLLVEQRYLGIGFPGIAEELGCDEDTAKARWRAILKCGVDNCGGLVTSKGWADLRAAVARRAAEAEA